MAVAAVREDAKQLDDIDTTSLHRISGFPGNLSPSILLQPATVADATSVLANWSQASVTMPPLRIVGKLDNESPAAACDRLNFLFARYPGTFKEDRLEERLSRTSSKTTPKPPMRAVDTLNLLAHETVVLGQDPLALISAV
jgi:hypothetical protein